MGAPKNQPSQQTQTGIEAERRRLESEFSRLRNELDLSNRYNTDKTRNEGLFNDAYSRYTTSLDRDIPETRAGFKRFSETGGVDEAARNRMRGGGVFDEFSRTGGWDPNRIGLYRQRAASQVPAFFASLKNEMQRGRAASGGMAPGFNASLAKASREAMKQQQEGLIGGELGLAEQVDTGRKWGTEGMERSEGNLQGLLTRNMLSGLGGMADTDRTRLSAIEGIRGLRTDVPSDLATLDRILALSGMENDARARLLAILGGMQDKPGFFEKYLGPLLGAGGSIIGGLASKPKPAPRPNYGPA